MTTQEIKDYLTDLEVARGYQREEINDAWLEEVLREGETVYEGPMDEHRWIIYFERVVKVGEKFFSFMDATATGDNSLGDCGYKWLWDEVREVFPVEKTIFVYEEKR